MQDAVGTLLERRVPRVSAWGLLALIVVAPSAMHASESAAPSVIATYDPWSDQSISCDEVERYPALVFDRRRDLGSGPTAPDVADYECPKSLEALPFMQKLIALAEDIRAGDPPGCYGSVVSTNWHGYHFALLAAGYAPEMWFKNESNGWAWDTSDDRFEWRNGTFDYFERWSYQGAYNRHKYRAFLREAEMVKPKLARLYRQRFGSDPALAQRMATRAIALVLDRAAGAFPHDDVKETDRLIAIARQVEAPAESLAAWVAQASSDDRRTALNIALLMEQDSEVVRLLVDRVGDLNVGEESPLFFALGNAKNVRYLLDRGADINYANPFGKTALFYAIQFNDRNLVELLLDRGADIHHRYASSFDRPQRECRYYIERTGRSTLMHAAQHADPAMLRLLLQRGANAEEVDGLEENATDYAYNARRIENAHYLESRGIVTVVQAESIKSDRAVASCRAEGKDRGLDGDALRDYMDVCWSAAMGKSKDGTTP